MGPILISETEHLFTKQLLCQLSYAGGLRKSSGTLFAEGTRADAGRKSDLGNRGPGASIDECLLEAAAGAHDQHDANDQPVTPMKTSTTGFAIGVEMEESRSLRMFVLMLGASSSYWGHCL